MTLAVGNGTALWYVTRASGVVSLLLLTTGLVLGVLGTVRWRSERWPRFAVVSVHRNLTLFAIASATNSPVRCAGNRPNSEAKPAAST